MKTFIVTYTTIKNDRLVRRQIVTRADSREIAQEQARVTLSEDSVPFNLNSCKEWDTHNIANKSLPLNHKK